MCEHINTTLEQLGFFKEAPLRDGKDFTQFYMVRCSECGDVFGVPKENFDLALSEGTEETKAKLQEIIGGELSKA